MNITCIQLKEIGAYSGFWENGRKRLLSDCRNYLMAQTIKRWKAKDQSSIGMVLGTEWMKPLKSLRPAALNERVRRNEI